jgi:hypothetical protein
MPTRYPICWRCWSTSRQDFRLLSLDVERQRASLPSLNFIALLVSDLDRTREPKERQRTIMRTAASPRADGGAAPGPTNTFAFQPAIVSMVGPKCQLFSLSGSHRISAIWIGNVKPTDSGLVDRQIGCGGLQPSELFSPTISRRTSPISYLVLQAIEKQGLIEFQTCAVRWQRPCTRPDGDPYKT